MRYLGIDYGTKRVGLALSDEAGTMGFPHATLPNDDRLVDEVAAIVRTQSVGVIVMGESLDFAGRENPVAQAARSFAQALVAQTDLPVHFEPEALTTQEARRAPDGTRPTRDIPVDASAAALILTSYLSRPHD